jgi:outer membrane lipoprotein-sorting protein
MRVRRQCRAVFVLFVIVAGVCAAAQDRPASLSANEIMRRVATANALRTARLRSYSSTRLYEVDYKGFGGDRHAKMSVNVTYQAGHKSFSVVSEEGSKLLLNRVIRKALESEEEAGSEEMRRRSALTEENYTFEFVTTESIDGSWFYVLQARPKRKDKYLYDGKVWIDATDFAIARIESQPAKNPSFWVTGASIKHSNRSVQGIWLPAKTESTSKVRFGGHAVLTIDYGKYENLVAE